MVVVVVEICRGGEDRVEVRFDRIEGGNPEWNCTIFVNLYMKCTFEREKKNNILMWSYGEG